MLALAQSNLNVERNPRPDGEQETDLPDTIVAREGSPLAAALRAHGWHARAGWRSRDTNGVTYWQIRFERAGERVW